MEITVDKRKQKSLFSRNRIYTIAEAAEILNLHPNTLYKLCRSGALGAYRSGIGSKASWRIPGENLEGLRIPSPEEKEGRRPYKQKEEGAK